MVQTSDSLHGDLGVRLTVDTQSLDWTQSPAPGVWRKRLHRVGPQESGQVTSIVRYDAGSSFRSHDHPEGEEILVLEGTFSDEHGHWPAGSHLLNPEGFRHAPFSREGCTLFVKLRQYGGYGRESLQQDSEKLAWENGSQAGIGLKHLYKQQGFLDSVRIERWEKGAGPHGRSYPRGCEILVLEGRLVDENGDYGALTWLRLPPGAAHSPSSPSGCKLYVKDGAVADLTAGDAR